MWKLKVKNRLCNILCFKNPSNVIMKRCFSRMSLDQNGAAWDVEKQSSEYLRATDWVTSPQKDML